MEQTNTSPIFLGFSSQKGGVGKSTLAEIVSSIWKSHSTLTPLGKQNCSLWP